MTPRIPPDNDDWTRRWLRSHRIPCEGDRLDSALESLDSAQWARLKAAWRKSEERRRGGFVMDLGRVLNRGKKLGSIWRRLIAWRVISEADALLLANDAPPGKPDATFYSDSINDLPLLEAVATPIVVDPDPCLHDEARRRGWRVVRLLA